MSTKYVIFHGAARSGNHAIIDWFRPIIPHVFVLNNCLKKESFRSLMEKMERNKVKRAAPDTDWESTRLGVSVENAQGLNYSFLLKRLEKHTPDFEYDSVVIIRDVFNCFASRLKHSNMFPRRSKPERNERVKNMWKGYARWALSAKDCCVVKYNSWIASQEYRKQVCAYFDKPLDDRYLYRVAGMAGGSSFDKRTIKDASQLNVTDRWKVFIDDPFYVSLFDQEIVELSEAVFGVTEASEAIRQKNKWTS